MNVKQSLASDTIGRILAPLAGTGSGIGDSQRSELLVFARQPVHTVYGGAHLFQLRTLDRLGELADAALWEYADKPSVFARLFDLDESLAERVHALVAQKLKREPVEDYRIDFEDGYGFRPDAEEDQHAVRAAQQMALAAVEQRLPFHCGFRIKALTEELSLRAVRTLDLFLTTLLESTSGKLPANFVVTLPKVTVPAQVLALHQLLVLIESHYNLPGGSIKIEIMIETPQALINANGVIGIPTLVAAAEGRCEGVHFGAYDYTALLGISAHHQNLTHLACDFARSLMQVSVGGSGVFLSDGATNTLPIAPHKSPSTSQQYEENRKVVLNAWHTSYAHITTSLGNGFYQGWDLHPYQIPVRYAANYAFFLSGFAQAAQRLRAFIDKAAQASLVQDMFDDAASGQGLLNFFLRALNCGAITEDDLQSTGLTKAEIETRSFVHIVKNRHQQASPPETERSEREKGTGVG